MADTVVVTVKNGRLRGKQFRSSFSGRIYFSFLGIPYAKPPLGDLRFKPPVEASPWTGVRDASVEGNDCIQYSFYHQRIVGSEDCLYLNVHAPQKPSVTENLKAVIVQIHSGGHLWGSGSSQLHGSPDYLMHQNIVYVTVNYRLHVFGFLNLKLEDCPGNVGIKDIIMALKWVQENIKHFGGDPDRVTLCGQCTGASLIHFLMMTPLAKGLYHRVIMMGDYIFNPLMNYRDDPLEIAFEFGKLLGFSGNCTAKLLQFLKSLPMLSMVTKMPALVLFIEKKYGRILPTAPFLPSVEHIEEGAVIPRSPVELMNSIEPVPIIFGVCENEAVFAFLNKVKLTPGKHYRKIFRENCWSWMCDLNYGAFTQLIKQIKEYYFGKENIYSNKSAIKIYNDAMLADFYDTVADILSKKSPSTPVYVYRFSYLGELNGMRNMMGLFVSDEIEGTIHSDDYFYMVKVPSPLDHPNKSDSKVVETLTRFVTNFAKTGNPNNESIDVNWNPSTPEKPYHLVLGQGLEVHQSKINEEQLEFWSKLKKDYKPN